MAEIDVTIRIDRDKTKELDHIVDRLRDLGLSDVQRQERFGIVHGRLPEAKLAEARAVPGIASLRKEKTFKALG